MSNNFQLLIDILVICLLIPTIIYAYRLNKNLNILRQNQNSFTKLIESLNEATFKAEKSIPRLKSITENSSEGLKEVVDNAKNLKEDLVFINDRANNLADKLEVIIHDSRNIKDLNSSAQTLNKKTSQSSPDIIKSADTDSRTLAEMELLKALRSIK